MKLSITIWFEDRDGKRVAMASCREKPGVIFCGGSMEAALNRFCDFLALDTMDEWGHE